MISNNYSFVHVDSTGIIIYRDINHALHHGSGPAIKHPGGAEYWYKHGRRHRSDGPSDIHPLLSISHGNRYSWYYEGDPYNFSTWCRVTGKSEEDILILHLKYPGIKDD